MKCRTLLVLSALLLASAATAQQWSDEQLKVWKTIEESWEANATDERGIAWLEANLHPDYHAVSSLLPMPIGKDKLIEGIKYDQTITRSDFYLLEPQRVIIHKDTAIVHYLYYWVYNTRVNADSAPETGSRKRRQTVVLVRENGEWLQIASHGTNID